MPKSKSHSKSPTHDRDRRGASDKPQLTPAQRERKTNALIAKWFGFYRVCSNAHCRRANACKGETCFKAYWDYVPEREKERFRKCILARCDGASVKEAIAAGEAAAQAVDSEVERWGDLTRPRAVSHIPTSEPVKHVTVEAPTRAPHVGPRIRRL